MQSLTVRLTLATLILSLLVSLGVTAVLLRVIYLQQITHANQRRDKIGRSIVPGLSSRRWLVDTDRANLLMDGLIHLPGIAFVRLDSEGLHMERGNAWTLPCTADRYIALNSTDFNGYLKLDFSWSVQQNVKLTQRHKRRAHQPPLRHPATTRRIDAVTSNA